MTRKFVLALFFLLSACSRFSSQSGGFTNSSLFSQGETALIPSTDMIAPDCMTNADFDACIVYKNPVAQTGTPINESDLTGVLQFGVKIRDLDLSGYLETPNFQVLTLNSPRFSLTSGFVFKGAYSSTNSYVEQVMTYYWVDRVFQYLGARLGASRLPVSGLKIYVDDAFTGFSSQAFSISLQKVSGKVPKAFSAEAVIQLTGQAIVHRLSGGTIFNTQDFTQHKTCGLSGKGCCASAIGCANALGSAFGDYLSGIMFPTKPRLGETIAESPSGQSICNTTRDLSTLFPATEAVVFSTCNGDITLEGAWYASLWWNIRNQAEAADPGASQDIDTLFFDHARVWTSTSTFLDAQQEALKLATSYKAGKYLSLIQSGLAAVK